MANKDWCRGEPPYIFGHNFSNKAARNLSEFRGTHPKKVQLCAWGHETFQNLGVKGPAIRGHNNYRNSRQKSSNITPIGKGGGAQCLPEYSGPHPPMRPAKEERRIQKFDREGTGGVGMGVVYPAHRSFLGPPQESCFKLTQKWCILMAL